MSQRAGCNPDDRLGRFPTTGWLLRGVAVAPTLLGALQPSDNFIVNAMNSGGKVVVGCFALP
jgi:hypothetical protein